MALDKSAMNTPINIYYVRAAIEAATGIRLTLHKTRQYLVEEGLISSEKAIEDAEAYNRYRQLFRSDGGGDILTENQQDIKDDINTALRIMET